MTTGFALTAEQIDLRRKARTFSSDVLADLHLITSRLETAEARFQATKPAYEEMIAKGFLRRSIPKPFGGESNGLMDAAIMAEELYAGDASLSLTLLGSVLGMMPVFLGGSESQRNRLLSPFLETSGAPLAAFAFSEPGGSANAASPYPGEGVRSIATLRGDVWEISGTKKWVSSATGWDGRGADLLCVVCRTAPDGGAPNGVSVIAMQKPPEGIILERTLDALGHRAHLLPVFRMEKVCAPAENLLGVEGAGLELVEAAFTATAALVGVFGVALMRAAFDFTLRFARTEHRGGVHPIIEHQAVGYALADAKTTIEAARSLSWRACQALDDQRSNAAELAIHAKIFGSEAAVRVITDLMRIVGVDSYDNMLPLGRLLQDALALPIFDGGNMGVRRKQLHAQLMDPIYDPLGALDQN